MKKDVNAQYSTEQPTSLNVNIDTSSKIIKVLNHGFVRLVDYMGNDQRICDAARVSFQNHEKDFDIEKDRNLLRYMMRHKHTSPFEQVEFTFHCKMPIFCARQWVRHRTASLNEVSGRYSQLKDEFYLPEENRIQSQSKTNNQGSDGIQKNSASQIQKTMDYEQRFIAKNYKEYLSEDVAKEIARINLPLSTYTEWYWKMDLHNLFHFLRLRLDSHAQWEMQQYGKAIAELIKPIVPLSWEAFEDYNLNAATFSKQELIILKEIVDNYMSNNDCLLDEVVKEIIAETEVKLSNRELTDLLSRLKIGV